ncbi:hypothetical protein I3J27_24820 [Bradyrhizobium xenonodulans]|uniref:DUF1835 domain-containing protein n=1 Tax=Bradyrhizobium xenonodulans TaxID=2736875 RepID=A0ABY7MD06_9BRAD|nr:hypothetical protein [Bradyrhizobium xenonodulans]WBL76238.1 hypothetical protein I3J27_24820 [Bradyrhizobium xenonodulans]
MKRVVLTSSSGVGLIHANPVDMVAPLIFRFVSGPLPTSHHLDQYLEGRKYPRDPEVQWSDLVRRSSQTGLAHKNLGLVWFCNAYGVDLIELWFDSEPNSQLLLIWILDYLRSEPYAAERLKLRVVDFDLLGAGGARLRDHTVRGFDVTERDFEAARIAWEAYRAPTPELCFGLLGRDFPKLPFLKPAMEQLLAELPSPITGLGATETQLLDLIAKGHNRTRELFQPGGLLDTRVFDQWELGPLLEGLASGPVPAIAGLDPKLATLAPHDARGRNAAYRRSRLSLTEFGRAVLEGREDFRRYNPLRRWWGGTLLTNERLWRWDPKTRSLIAPT